MTAEKFVESTGFKVICMPRPERDISGVYIGDLLSWVMGRAESNNVWITIMSNSNIVAVATLADVSCILLAEGVVLDGEVSKLAAEKGVNIFSTELSCYDAAIKVSKVI